MFGDFSRFMDSFQIFFRAKSSFLKVSRYNFINYKYFTWIVDVRMYLYDFFGIFKRLETYSMA
jgi:hypothetical protein